MAKKSEVKNSERIKRDILEYIDPKVYNCYQCGKCTAGCPLSDIFEYKPNQVIDLVRAGRIDDIINSNSIFLCLSCAICSSRCPQDIHIASIMNFIRNEAWKSGRFKVKSILRFYRTFLRIIGTTGRSYEPGLLMSLNFLSGRLFNDMDLAFGIIKKRKISFLPDRIKGRKDISRTVKKYL